MIILKIKKLIMCLILVVAVLFLRCDLFYSAFNHSPNVSNTVTEFEHKYISNANNQILAIGATVTGEAILGFTLAEVMVVIAIVGAIAAMTIPDLINNIQTDQYKSAYKKAFADYSNALINANNDGVLLQMIAQDNQNNITNFLAIKNYFTVIKDCSSSNNSNCWASGETYNTTPNYNAYSFIDSQGRSWSTRLGIAGGGWYVSIILVDTNGMKGPNQYGKDRFPLLFYDSNSLSVGMPVKIGPQNDFSAIDASYCPSGGCYNTSWLTNSK